jgi:voltage-gated potassium channel
MNHERPRLRGSSQAGPSGNAVERIERFTEVPMLVLAIAYVPAFIVEYLPDVPPEIRQDADIVQWTIVAAFAVELLVKVAVADRRLSYLRSHWPEVLIVVLPFLRPLRVLLVLPFLIRAVRGLERILGPYKAAYVLVLWLLTVFTGAGLVLLFEEGSGGTINGFWDALWWAVTTITTVGYGDTYPVTFAGRVVAIVVMLVGIILFGVLTAGVAAYFVERVEERDEGEQTHKLDLVLKRLDEQEERNKKVDLLLVRLEEIERRLEGRNGRSGGD